MRFFSRNIRKLFKNRSVFYTESHECCNANPSCSCTTREITYIYELTEIAQSKNCVLVMTGPIELGATQVAMLVVPPEGVLEVLGDEIQGKPLDTPLAELYQDGNGVSFVKFQKVCCAGDPMLDARMFCSCTNTPIETVGDFRAYRSTYNWLILEFKQGFTVYFGLLFPPSFSIPSDVPDDTPISVLFDDDSDFEGNLIIRFRILACKTNIAGFDEIYDSSGEVIGKISIDQPL